MEAVLYESIFSKADLMAGHPEIFQKVPLAYIASYLGITPESLSRIRKKMM